MSNLIETNPQNPSIKSVDLGNVRFVSFEECKVFKIRFYFSDGSVHCSQEAHISPSELQHSLEFHRDSPLAVIRNDSGLEVSFRSGLSYLAVCKLFSMSPSEDVIHAFGEKA
ncbi:hypothetical protein [Vibrio sinaloensis]|uniref:hypothetical protein n=1 Tax=Photobacterium sp. (strain ATCC 43367) TaxID=379097 RepID=UPI00068E1572|nr:hypothetical protein [Vibrio sinaloensis]